jgi:hypothetical protein
LLFNGDSRFTKEQYFVKYDFSDTKVIVTSNFERQMDRIQVCCVQSSSFKNGSTFVKMKNWINEIADSITWKKLDEKIDNGRVGTKSNIAQAYMMRLSFVEYQE